MTIRLTAGLSRRRTKIIQDVADLPDDADRFGYYQMSNEVVEYEEGRRLTWEPGRVVTSPDGQEEIDSAHYRWGYELAPDGPGATMVTETFDCTRSPADLRDAVNEGEGWRDAMTASLAKLELLAKTPK
jgi:hypothetical protein